jgi:hypothetical protein
MTEKKILLKEVYKNLLSEAYTEKNDKLLPILAYDNEVIEKIEKLITIDAQDYEIAIDSKNSKNYYETYLRIFYGIIKCENEEDLGKWKDSIIENNPWKEALEKESNKYRSIADSDRSILLSLLEAEIQVINEENLEDLGEIYQNKVNREDLASTFFENIFRDFEQAFDGNFENPRVIFMGINPKIVELDHDDYNLANLYLNPFDSKRPVLMNKNLDEDYYFKNGGFFFTKSESDEEVREEFIRRVCEKSEITPFAFWEFYPYATMNQKNWYKEIEIRNGKIKKYFEWHIVLPSQIWLLCLLSYAIKKAQFENKELILYCTKKNAPFAENTMMPLVDILEIDKNKRICILTSKSQNRVFSKGNIKAYSSTVIPKFIKLDSNKEFFASVWGIEGKS